MIGIIQTILLKILLLPNEFIGSVIDLTSARMNFICSLRQNGFKTLLVLGS